MAAPGRVGNGTLEVVGRRHRFVPTVLGLFERVELVHHVLTRQPLELGPVAAYVSLKAGPLCLAGLLELTLGVVPRRQCFGGLVIHIAHRRLRLAADFGCSTPQTLQPCATFTPVG